MIVAGDNSKEAYGSVDEATPVRKPLMVLASLPRKLSPGEKVTLPVTVFAMEPKVKQANISLKLSKGIKIVGQQTQSVSFAKPDEKMVYFELDVSEAQGIGKIQAGPKGLKPKRATVGKTSIEDVMLALGKKKGNKGAGKKILSKLACIACHNVKPSDPIKGPDFHKMGSRLNKDQIAEAILKPAATISDSWVTVTMKDGTAHQGTLVSKGALKVVINNIAGIGTTVKASDVKSIAKQTSTLMAPGLANELSIKQFVDLIEYLYFLK